MQDFRDLLASSLPNGYAIDRQLGKGGQGTVYRGMKDSAVPVALKIFHSPDIERLNREILLLQSVKCDFVVRLLDYFTLEWSGTTVYVLVYELIDNGDLRVGISNGAKMQSDELLILGEQIGQAIEALWEKRIVHRDIKPENIIRASDGRFVLVDVGFAQHLDLATITPSVGQPGTNGYRSPEQCGNRKRLTIHSDVFSLGVTIFEVATGKHPWGGNQALVGRIPIRESLRSLRLDLDAKVEFLIYQMLDSIPSRRPANPAERFARLRS